MIYNENTKTHTKLNRSIYDKSFTKEQAELLARHLGFPTLLRFESFLTGDYDLTDDRADGLEDKAAIVEADKSFFDIKW